jgi:integrase
MFKAARGRRWRTPIGHTSATLALAAGVHPKVVQERPGHSSISITLDTNSHIIKGLQREAAEKVAALLVE